MSTKITRALWHSLFSCTSFPFEANISPYQPQADKIKSIYLHPVHEVELTLYHTGPSL